MFPWFLADRTNGRAYATVLRLSVCLSVCDVMYCGYLSLDIIWHSKHNNFLSFQTRYPDYYPYKTAILIQVMFRNLSEIIIS